MRFGRKEEKEMNEHFLPEIIRKIGEYPSSLLFQPQTQPRTKRNPLSRKNNYTQINPLQRINLLLDANHIGKDSPSKIKKYYRYSRKNCYTEPAQTTSLPKITLEINNTHEYKPKKQEGPNLYQPKGTQPQLESTITISQRRYSDKPQPICHLNHKVKRYTSVCSSYSRAIANLMQPMPLKVNKTNKQTQQLAIGPWNTSFYPFKAI